MIEINKYRLSTSPVTAWGEIHGDINDQQDLIEKIQESGGVSKAYVDGEISRVEGEVDEKQNILVAGDNITIEGDVISASGGVSKAYVDAKISQVESEIPSLEGYATESWVEGKGYLTEHQDITGKADVSYVDAQISDVEAQIPSLEGYATETYVDTKISEVESEIPSLDGYATESWVEGKGYLTEHQPIKTLNGESLIGTGDIEINPDTDEIESVIGDGFGYLNKKVDDNFDIQDEKIESRYQSAKGLVDKEKNNTEKTLDKADNITAAGIYYSVKTEDDTVKNIIAISQTDYDDIEEPDEKTLYIIID